MRESKSPNPQLTGMIAFLKKQSKENKNRVWKDIARRLAKPRRQNLVVNLSRLNRYTVRNETVIVPGKVLATGDLKHPITVTAFAFSKRAREKIIASRGKCLSFHDLLKKNPAGSKVKIIG